MLELSSKYMRSDMDFEPICIQSTLDGRYQQISKPIIDEKPKARKK